MVKHEEHTDPVQKHRHDPTSVLYGLLPGISGDGGKKLEGDIDDEHLLMCCGEKRPLGKGTRAIVITPTTRKGAFVTIHDFISAVHPCSSCFRSY
jgi:hypothetical protein